MRPLDLPCGEQGKLPIAKAFKLAERDKTMSEEKQPSYMQQLDGWTRSTIINPLEEAAGLQLDRPTVECVFKAVREKTLESFRNGLKAKDRPAKQPQRAVNRVHIFVNGIGAKVLNKTCKKDDVESSSFSYF